MNDIMHAVRTDFQAFVAKAFRELEGRLLDMHPYVGVLCSRLAKLSPGGLVVNLPPRHLKTFVGSVCLAAWTLAQKPRARIMVVAGSEDLAEEIAFKVRDTVRSNWFAGAFPGTRLSKSKSRKMDFATTAGGALYATSILGNFTGRGADLIIVDDPLDIRDASNPDKIDRVNKIFDNVIVSRLDNPKMGSIVVIMHRLHDDDLCGHVFDQGGWDRIILPMIAPRKKTYDLGYKRWTRKKGELLRPDAYSSKKVDKLRKNTTNPDFELLYQQNPLGHSFRRVKREHFGTFVERPDSPVVLSIDPSFVESRGSSHNVIQAWCKDGQHFFLIDQWRKQCGYLELRRHCLRLAGKYRPGAILVERTANGAALIDELRHKRWKVNEIIPQESKLERFRRVSGLIRTKKILLKEDAHWREDFLTELTGFPSASTDDQVDAMTQALNWFLGNPIFLKAPERALAVIADRRIAMAGTHPPASNRQTIFGGVLARKTAPNGPFIQPKVWVRY